MEKNQAPTITYDSTGKAWVRSASEEQRLERLRSLADWMDAKFTLPGTDFKFGLDPVLGLVPGIGDTVAFLISCYIVMEAEKMGVSTTTRYRMMGNIFLDLFIGSIPLLGDLFDAGFKANRKNIALLHEHLGKI